MREGEKEQERAEKGRQRKREGSEGGLREGEKEQEIKERKREKKRVEKE